MKFGNWCRKGLKRVQIVKYLFHPPPDVFLKSWRPLLTSIRVLGPQTARSRDPNLQLTAGLEFFSPTLSKSDHFTRTIHLPTGRIPTCLEHCNLPGRRTLPSTLPSRPLEERPSKTLATSPLGRIHLSSGCPATTLRKLGMSQVSQIKNCFDIPLVSERNFHVDRTSNVGNGPDWMAIFRPNSKWTTQWGLHFQRQSGNPKR